MVLALRFGVAESFLFLGMVIGGVLGIGGVWMLLSRYFCRELHVRSNRLIASCLVAGFLAYAGYLIVAVLSSPTAIELLIFGMPAICAVHVLYVTRSCWTSS
jgi:hypothetical protein